MKLKNYPRKARTLHLALLMGLFILPGTAWALQEPSRLPTDQRLRTYTYDPNDVYKFTGHYKFQSSIELSPSETIATISLGDSLAWQVTPSGNRIFLKPVEPDATTNMTVVTNQRIYHFELHAEEAESIEDEAIVFAARFFYPNETEGGALKHFHKDKEPDLENDAEKFNFRYTVSGSTLSAPTRIFDDGEFTYFQFPEKNAEIPAFYMVDPDGTENVINYHMAGRYVVVERVASQFTLRNGPEVTCVFNEQIPQRPVPPEPERKLFGVW